jgi:hypothetical protein
MGTQFLQRPPLGQQIDHQSQVRVVSVVALAPAANGETWQRRFGTAAKAN